MASIGKLTLTVVVDREAADRAVDTLTDRLGCCIADPVLVHEVVDQILQAGPIVRYIAEPTT